MRITSVRRGRTIKVAVCGIIAICIIYVLYSTPEAHQRARDVIQSRFSASKARELPKLVPGECSIVVELLLWHFSYV